jgi:Cu(I)/Ag(I) efflux system membrane fusion protein
MVPSEAVLRTGARDVVIVVLEDAASTSLDDPTLGSQLGSQPRPRRFAPREVQLGRRYDGRTEILSGLSEGELVVVSGQFLLDSEAQIQAAIRSQLDALDKPGENSP